ncbi:MAG: VCBS repeat-containing protein [Anaerolineales bacterium]|nr:VCBS repeat-containing protein [Anaerolineales bacterium]
MDKLGKVLTVGLLNRSAQPRPSGEFPDGYPEDMLRVFPEEPPLRTWIPGWGRMGLAVIFLLLILVVSWIVTHQQGAEASPLGISFTNTNQALDNEGSDVALGDLDGDGDLDAFLARYDSDRVWLNNGQGGFISNVQTLGSNPSVAVALGDLDGDTDLDAVVLEDTGAAIVRWFNQGGIQGGTPGTFAQSGAASGPDMPGAVALGDLDGDGDLDILLARILGRPSQVWLNDGAGQFIDSGQTLINDGSNGVALGDVDGDGDLDALTADGSQLRLWVNQGGDQGGTEGVFMDAGQSLPTALSMAVALGDVDGDGDLDAASAQMNSGWQLWINQGGDQGGTEGVFTANGAPMGGTGNRHLALDDVDGNGSLDVFVARAGANTVWLNQGDGAFQDSGAQLGTLFSEAVALGDLDDDGDPDAVVANFDGNNEVWCNGACDAAPLSSAWQLEAVYTEGQLVNADMTMDGQGRLHIAFLKVLSPNEYVLKYLVWDTVTWHESSVAITQRYAGVPKILTDNDMKPHIFLNNLHYFPTDTGWAVETIPYPENVTVSYSLPVSDGNSLVFHVFGLTQSQTIAYMALQADGSWTVMSTDLFGTVSSTGRDTLAGQLNSQGYVVLTFLKDGGLYSATQNANGWVIYDMGVPAEGPLNVAVDAQNVPHFTYRSPDTHYPSYISNVSGLSTIQTQAASAVTLSLYDDENPVVFWQSETGEILRSQYVNPENWLTEVVMDENVIFQTALLSGERSMVLFRENVYKDLWVAWSGLAWEQQFTSFDYYDAPTLAVNGDTPALTFNVPYTNNENALFASWNDPWTITLLGQEVEPTYNVPLSYKAGQPQTAHYQTTSRTLIYTHFEGQNLSSETAHTFPAEQTFQPPLFLLNTDYSLSVGLGYTFIEGGERYLGLSLWNANENWIHTQWTPGIGNPADFSFASGMRGDGTAIFIYAYNSKIYRAVYKQGQWSTAPILSAVTPTHLALAIETRYSYGASTLPPIVLDRETLAFTDGLSGELLYAADTDDIWETWVVGEPAPRKEVALVHRAGNWKIPVIATLGEDNSVSVITTNDSMTVWKTEIIAEETSSERSYLSVAYGARDRLAWLDKFVSPGRIIHAFRRAPRIEGTGQLNDSQSLAGALYKGGCLCIYFGLNGCTDGWATSASFISSNTYAPTGDLMVDLNALFQATPEGYAFATKYVTHDHELWTIIFSDSDLLWDSYRTLNNMLPGLKALTIGQGAQAEISQEMMDQALDIWQRVAAEASPALAGEINTQLAATHNLQDYVGMTFDEWALSLGVEPFSGYQVYLPEVLR